MVVFLSGCMFDVRGTCIVMYIVHAFNVFS